MHLLHLLSELLHFFGGVLLAAGSFFVFAFFELFRPLLHLILDGLLFLRAVHHGVGVFELLVVFFELIQLLAELLKRLVEAVLLRFEVVGVHEAQIRFFRQTLLFFCELFQVFDGLIHLRFPFELLELLKRAIELFFHGVMVELHFVELFLNFFRVHLLHELFHLLVDLTEFLAHDVVHEFLELLLLVKDALFLFVELVGPIVFALVLFAHLLELVLKGFLLLEQVFHRLAVLPSHLALLAHALLHGLHGFSEFRSFAGGLFEVFFDAFCGFFALLTNVIGAWRGNSSGSRSGHFGAMHAVVVPNLKPAFQHVALSPVQVRHVPGVKEGPLTS